MKKDIFIDVLIVAGIFAVFSSFLYLFLYPKPSLKGSSFSTQEQYNATTTIGIVNPMVADLQGGAFKILNLGNVAIGTSTTNVRLSVVNQPVGDGSVASSTLQIGNISTTTSKSSIQMNNTAGSPECVYLVGTTLTVTAGTCN